MKRVLLIAYYFPPLAGSGVFRPLRMARTLPADGWEVTVLTVGVRARVMKDPELAAEVPPSVRVERTASLEPRVPLLALNRAGLGALTRRLEPWFMIPDDQRGWVPFASRRALRLHRRVPFDAVVSTAGPYSAHLIGRALARSERVPWVADFRDEWTTNPYLVPRYPTAWHRRLNRGLEASVLREADRVVCVSGPWLEALHALVPDQPASKFRVHPNGYDPAHFVGAAPARADRFRVVYTGTFYGHRSPRVFLEAVRRVIADGRIPAEDLEVRLVGHGDPVASATPGLPDGILRVVAQRPFRQALHALSEAAVLLLVVPPEGGAGNHTGKLFNYLAARRPILALAPEPNVAADLVRDSRSGVVAPPDDPDAIATALVGLHRDWKAGRVLADQRTDLVRAYAADAQGAAYARLLDELAR